MRGGTLADHVGIVTAVNPGGTVDLVNGDFLGGTNIGVEHDTGISLTSWASHIWRPGEQWVLVKPPAGHQAAAPAVTVTGPAKAVAGTSVSFRASASGPITKYRWTFGDGRATNVSGAAVSHVYAENGVYPVTVSAMSSGGTVTTRAVEVEVSGGSSAVASVPDNAVWYHPAPVDQYVFLPAGHGLAADSWDGANWRQAGIPGRPDRGGRLTALSYPDPEVGCAMTPHAYYAADGMLTETYLARTGWTTRPLAGRPAAGSAIVADARVSGPEVFFFGAGGLLASPWPPRTSGAGRSASCREARPGAPRWRRRATCWAGRAPRPGQPGSAPRCTTSPGPNSPRSRTRPAASRGAPPRCPARPPGSSARTLTRRPASRAGSSCPADPGPASSGWMRRPAPAGRGPGSPRHWLHRGGRRRHYGWRPSGLPRWAWSRWA